MKKILLALTLAAASISTVSANGLKAENTQIKMVATNTEVASKACVLAAQKNERIARQKYSIMTKEITCNGMPIDSFAKKYKNAKVL